MCRKRNGLVGDEGSQIGFYFFTHGEKSVAGLYKIARENRIAGSGLMRNYIVSYANDAGVFILFDQSQDGA